MEMSCDIIRDILPLYAEDMVSDATRNMVDDHLCGCDGCTKELAALKKTPKVPVDTEVNSLKRVSDTIRRRKVLTVLCVLMTIASILVTGMEMCANTQLYLPYDKAIESVEYREDGSLVIDYARGIVGHAGVTDEDNEAMFCNTTVYAYIRARILDRKLEKMTREEIEDYIADLYDIEKMYQRTEVTQEDWNRFFGIRTEYCFRDNDGNRHIAETPELPEGYLYRPNNQEKSYTRTDHDYNLIYMNRDGSGGVVMHAGGKEAPDMALYEKYGEAGYLYEEAFYGCALIAAGLWLLLRKKKAFRCRELVVRLALLLGSIAFGILTISHGQFNYTGEHMSYGTWMDGATVIAVVTVITALLWRQLCLLNRQDKAI